MSVLSHISGFEYFGSAVGFPVLFLLCCPLVSLDLTSYSLRPDYMLPKWIKKDVSRTEIRLDPSIFLRMEGIHVNMSCLSILQYLFHLSIVACSMFYN